MGFFDLHNHQLQSFLTVAESNSFSSAAEKLFISHTALIQQMNTLERALGFHVFLRSPRGVKLTDSGKMFYDGLQHLMQEANEIITRCQDLEENGQHIRVGNMNDLHTFYFYADFYRQFKKDNLGITLDFIPTVSENVLDMCRSGVIDVGFYFGLQTQAENPDLVFRAASIPNMCIVVSKKNPFAKKGTVQAEDLSGKTILAFNVSDPALIYSLVPAIDRGKLVMFDATMQSVYEYSERGSLIILPIWFAEQFPNLMFLPFSPPVPFIYQVVYRKEHSTNVQKFVNAYLEYDANL